MNKFRNTTDCCMDAELVNSECYQRELKKLKKHYGVRATLKSYQQAAWDKRSAYARKRPINELWLRVEAEKDIIAADFAMDIHLLLAEGKTAEEIILKLGGFEEYLRSVFANCAYQLLSDKQVTAILKRTKRKWWFEY